MASELRNGSPVSPHEAIYQLLLTNWKAKQIEQVADKARLFMRKAIHIQRAFQRQIEKRKARIQTFERRWDNTCADIVNKAQKLNDK